MLSWLVQEGFIVRCGIDEKLSIEYSNLSDSTIADNENSWDDDIPAWVASAQTVDGVEINQGMTGDSPNEVVTRRTSAHSQPSLGFRRADDLELTVPVEVKTADPPAMTYEATAFGSRTSQLYLDPLSASTLRTGLRRAVRRIARNEEGLDVTNFGLLFLASSTPDFVGF